MGFSQGQLASASLIGQIGGGLTSAVGSYYSAGNQASSLKFQSTIAGINAGIANTNADAATAIGNANADAIQTVGDFNATIANLGAESALAAGQQEVAAQTLKAGQIKSGQRAAMAANGIDLGEGSAAEVQASTDIMKGVDANTLQANAVRTAWGYRAQGLNASLQAGVQSMNTRTNAAMQSINLRGGAISQTAASAMDSAAASATSLLGSAGKVASNWYEYNKNGMLKGAIFSLG